MQGTFERKEKKYVLSRQQAEALLAEIADRVEPDLYPESRISSVYYDTPRHEVIERSLDKPTYKEKLRVRDYGTGSVFVELKKKYKGIVYKRRIELSKEAARSWLDEGMAYAAARNEFPLPGREGSEPTYMERQISKEVDNYMSRYRGELVPSMDVFAHRLSYREKGGNGTRITFDVEILYSDMAAGQEVPARLTDSVVMEVKVPGAYPLWLASALTKLGLHSSSFSKYGSAYKLLYLGGRDAKPARPAVPVAAEPVPTRANRAFSPAPISRKAAAYA